MLERAAYAKRAIASAKANRRFRAANPERALPPLRLLWDAQSHTEYERYWSSGRTSAEYYWHLIRDRLPAIQGSPTRICEWGCGPGRIIRHLPDVCTAYAVTLYATDYNAVSIRWCQRNIPGITFLPNDLAPPLPFADGSMDVLYCRSVFTHLSEEMHYRWMAELRRVVREGGLIILSTQGRAHMSRLIPSEREKYERRELVVRQLAQEGKLFFSAFHHPDFVRGKLLAGMMVEEHQPGKESQDVWVVRR